jgi:RimJ/RimL family protein N-acetyltransferase
MRKEEIISFLKDVKSGNIRFELDILSDKKEKLGKIRPILDSKISDNSEIIRFITKWREYYKENFISQFPVSEERTKNWLQNQVINKDNRILFIIQTPDGKLAGHIGVIFFEVDEDTCEIDNVVKAADCNIPGLMYHALKTLNSFLFNSLKMKKIFLRVFSDNIKAKNLYLACGFSKTKEIKLKRVVQGDTIKYIEIPEEINEPYDRILDIMEILREE